jgi:hypothetical protein
MNTTDKPAMTAEEIYERIPLFKIGKYFYPTEEGIINAMKEYAYQQTTELRNELEVVNKSKFTSYNELDLIKKIKVLTDRSNNFENIVLEWGVIAEEIVGFAGPREKVKSKLLEMKSQIQEKDKEIERYRKALLKIKNFDDDSEDDDPGQIAINALNPTT